MHNNNRSILASTVTLVAVFIALVDAQGRVPPHVPEEFYGNIIQNKFNHNGFGVNHTCAGTYYSSLTQMKIRADCTAVGYSSNNASQPSPIASMFQSSVFDFNKNNNIQYVWSDFKTDPTCWDGPAGWLPPMPKTFLSDVGAVFAGERMTAEYGDCQAWTFIVPQLSNNTIFTFLFDKYQQLVEFEFVVPNDPQQGAVGVTNKFYNIVTGNSSLLPTDIFNGADSKCPKHVAKTSTPFFSLA